MGPVTILLIIANILFSYRGLTNVAFFERYKFQVDKIRLNRNYKRLITSGFLHVNWQHLFFNMLALFCFGSIEYHLGDVKYLLVYFASLIGGNLFSLLFHKDDGSYSSVGASGAIAGVIFATIALFPDLPISFFFLPIYFPVWIYGLVFVLYSIYGIRSKTDNVGHEAHLGGAMAGMILAIAMEPSVLVINYLPITIIGVTCIVFIYIILTRPQVLMINNYFFENNKNLTIDQRYNAHRTQKQHDIDRILDKINQRGMGSLTEREKQILREQ